MFRNRTPARWAGLWNFGTVGARKWPKPRRQLENRIARLAIGVSLLAPSALAAPEAFPPERYNPMKSASPFTLATPVVEKAAPPFARGMFVSGIAQIGKKEIVSVMTQDKLTFTLMTGMENPDGIELVSVDWSDEVGRTRVSIRKGAEHATLQFNEEVLKTPIAVTPVPPGGPTVAPGGTNVRRPATAPTRPRRIIRRPSR